jgi:hypothetical protein
VGILFSLIPMTHSKVREAEGRAQAYRLEAELAAAYTADAMLQLQESAAKMQRMHGEVAAMNAQLQHLTTWYHANKDRIPTATDDELRDIIMGPGR